MSQTIKLKRSSVAGKVPTTGNLDLGEIALNTNDGKVFFKKNDGTDSIQTILTTDAEITGNLYLSGSLTASSALIGPLTFPITDGAAGQFLKTDGAGNIGFVDGVSFPYTGSAIISSSLQVTGSSSVTGSFSLNDYSLPETDGGDGQVIMTNGEGTLVFNDVVKYVTVKNIETVTLPKGTPVHATSSVGNTVEVVAASASLARTMPATFVLNESLDPDQEGRAILTGFINGVNTSGFNEGDVVYVGGSGGYTNVQPTGTNLIQNLGIVTVIDASNGAGYIYGSGRANATPNLLNGEVFFGEGNVSIQKPLSDILSGSSYVYSGSFSGSFEGDGSGLTGVGGIFSVSGSDVDNNQFSSEVSVLQFDSSTGLNVSQSAEGTAFVSIGSHYRDIVINGQTTLVATGSDQLELIAGDGIDLTTSTSDTNANSVSKEINFSVDSSVLRTTGDSVVSSSTQIDHDQTTNYSSDEHFTQANITTVGTVTVGNVNAILPSGTVSSSAQLEGTFDSRYLNTTGDSVISSSEQVNADNITNFDTNVKDKLNTDGVISSSAQLDGTFLEITGDSVISSSAEGDGQGQIKLNGVNVNTNGLGTDDSPQFTNLTLSGDLTVNGTTTTVNSTEVEIGDRIIVLNGQDAAGDSGINVYDTSTNQTGSLLWDSAGDYWKGGELGSEVKFLRQTGDSIVSSSAQIDHDQTTNFSSDEHFTQANITTLGTVTAGSVTAILPSGTVSSSAQVNADNVTNFDTNVKDKMNTDGVISSSAQIDHDSTTNYSADEHFTQGDITTVGTVTVGSVTAILPAGTVSGSDQLTNTFLEITGDSVVSSSAQIDHDQTTNYSADEHFTQGDITTVGTVTVGSVTAILPAGTVSGSSQIDHDQTTNYSSDEHFTQANITTVGTVTSGDVSGILPSGVVSGSDQLTNTFLEITGDSVVSSSEQVSYTGLSNIPSGIVSGSSQVSYTGLSNIPSGIVSSSAQIDHDQTTNYSSDEHFTQGDITTVGTVTSGDVSAILPSGVVSGSAEGDGQGQIKLNGVNVNTNGLGTDDSPTFSGLTIDTDTLYVDSTNNNVGIGNLTPSGSLHIGDNNGTRRIILHGANSQTTSSEIIFGDSKGGAVPNITYAGMGMRYDSQNNILSIRRFWDGGAETDESFVNFDRDSKLTTFTDDVVVSGDLTVNGTTTTVNSTEVEIGDRVIALNTADGSGDAGLYVHDTSTAETGSLLWDSTGNYWKGGLTGSEARFLTVDDEGSENGLDADTVDSLEASQFLRSDANDTATGDIRIENANNIPLTITGSHATYTSILVGNSGTGAATLWLDGSNGDLVGGDYAAVQQTNDKHLELLVSSNGGDIIFTESGAETMRLKDGNVGIGTNNPSIPLHVSKSEGANFIAALQNQANDGHGLYIQAGGTSGTRYITQWRDAAGTERFHMDDTGETYFQNSVGIGTTDPSTKLHLYEPGASDVIFRITPANASYDSLIQLTGQGNDMTVEGFEMWYDNSVGDVHLSTTFTSDDAAIRFHTRTGASKSTSNERMTIDGNGNVGIGTTSPDAQLELETASAPSVIRLSRKTTTNDGDAIGQIDFRDNASGGTFARVEGLTTDNTGGSLDGALVFSTQKANSFTEAMRIESGKVGIGQTDLSGDVGLYVKKSAGTVIKSETTGTNTNPDVLIVDADNNNARASLQVQGNGGTIESLWVSSTGNVGIGTTAPSQPLTVEGNISSSGDFTIRKDEPTIRLVDNNTSTTNFPRIILDTNNNQGVMLYHNEFDSFLPESGYGLVLGPSPNNTQFPSTGDLTFQVLGNIYADTETTGSGYKVLTTNDGLSKVGDSVVSSSVQISHDSTTGFVSNEHIDHSGVSITAGSGLTGGGNITTSRTINVGSGDGISVAADSVAVDSTVVRTSGDQTIAGNKTFSNNVLVSEYIYHSGDTDTYIRFQPDDISLIAGNNNLFRVDGGVSGTPKEIVVNESGANTDFRIESDTVTNALFVTGSTGDVGIKGGADTSFALKVTGDFAATGEVTAYVSDERLKDIISPITEPIQKIQSLDGFYYLFNETAESIGIESGDKRHVGLSAQQVQKVLPEIVTFAPADRQDGKSKTGEDYLTIHYDKLVPLLVEGIKEQQQTIEKLQNEVKELQKVIRRA